MQVFHFAYRQIAAQTSPNGLDGIQVAAARWEPDRLQAMFAVEGWVPRGANSDTGARGHPSLSTGTGVFVGEHPVSRAWAHTSLQKDGQCTNPLLDRPPCGGVRSQPPTGRDHPEKHIYLPNVFTSNGAPRRGPRGSKKTTVVTCLMQPFRGWHLTEREVSETTPKSAGNYSTFVSHCTTISHVLRRVVSATSKTNPDFLGNSLGHCET